MKKFLFLVFLLFLVAGFYYWKNINTLAPFELGNVQDKNFQPDAQSATFHIEGRSTPLSQGNNVSTDKDTGETTETRLLDEKAYGDLNKDGKDDVVVLLSQSGSGSGVFMYVAAYVSGPVNYKGSSAIFIGDRISPLSLSIVNGTVTVNYLDREPDEPFAADPTVPTSKQFIYRNGEFVER